MLELGLKSLLAYLLGSVAGALVLGQLGGFDIRAEGSGNAGATNALRTRGKSFAAGVLLIDLAKGWLAAARPIATTASPTAARGIAARSARQCQIDVELSHTGTRAHTRMSTRKAKVRTHANTWTDIHARARTCEGPLQPTTRDPMF